MEACLQDHREQDGFSERCRQALEARMERQAADYQLNYGLRCGGLHYMGFLGCMLRCMCEDAHRLWRMSCGGASGCMLLWHDVFTK